jgi:hypothetical protein
MKTATHLILVISALSVMAGCVSSPYWMDRQRDVADVFTATSGWGWGAGARVGPVKTGCLLNRDLAGLRCGEYSRNMYSDMGPGELTLVIWSIEQCCSYNLQVAAERGKWFWAEGLCGLALARVDTWAMHEILEDEDPAYPVVFVPEQFFTRRNVPYYINIEITAGLLKSARLGFNAGELLDLALGVTTLDLFNDDVGLISEDRTTE